MEPRKSPRQKKPTQKALEMQEADRYAAESNHSTAEMINWNPMVMLGTRVPTPLAGGSCDPVAKGSPRVKASSSSTGQPKDTTIIGELSVVGFSKEHYKNLLSHKSKGDIATEPLTTPRGRPRRNSTPQLMEKPKDPPREQFTQPVLRLMSRNREESPAATPRGRGRPRKNAGNIVGEKEVAVNEESTPTTKKVVQPTEGATKTPNASPASTSTLPVMSKNTDESPAATPRGRGRPRKNTGNHSIAPETNKKVEAVNMVKDESETPVQPPKSQNTEESPAAMPTGRGRPRKKNTNQNIVPETDQDVLDIKEELETPNASPAPTLPTGRKIQVVQPPEGASRFGKRRKSQDQTKETSKSTVETKETTSKSAVETSSEDLKSTPRATIGRAAKNALIESTPKQTEPSTPKAAVKKTPDKMEVGPKKIIVPMLDSLSMAKKDTDLSTDCVEMAEGTEDMEDEVEELMVSIPEIDVPVPHESFVVKGIAVERQCHLVECRDKLCPSVCYKSDSPVFHCPLCPAVKFRCTDTSQASSHLRMHSLGVVTYGDLLVLQCMCKKGALVVHWHCPKCGVILSSTEGMSEHLEMCSGILEEEELSAQEVGKVPEFAGDELAVESEDEDAQVELDPKRLHCSILLVGGDPLSQFQLLKCRDLQCPSECTETKFSLYHCPLCVPGKWRGANSRKCKKDHYQMHLKEALVYKEFLVLQCRCWYQAQRHFHCPTCAVVVAERASMQAHMKKGCKMQKEISLTTMTKIDVKEPHISIVKTNQKLEDQCLFDMCVDPDCPKKCCENNEDLYHCRMCPRSTYGGTLATAKPHLLTYHRKYGIPLRDIVLLVCRCGMVGTKSRSHWHCPVCGSIYITKTSMLYHLKNNCENGSGAMKRKKEASDIVNEIIAPEPAKKRKLQPEEDLELKQMLAAKTLKFTHMSFVEKLSDLPLKKQKQCCQRYHCPLCFTFLHRSAAEVKKHLVSSHWKYRVEIQAMKVAILKCSLSCSSSVAASHWHCPICNITNINRTVLANHIIRHERCGCDLGDKTIVRISGVTQEEKADVSPAPEADSTIANDGVPEPPEVDDEDGGNEDVGEPLPVDAASATHAPPLMHTRRKPKEIFQLVSAVMDKDVDQAIPGDAQIFFDKMQQMTGVEFIESGQRRTLVGKLDKVLAVHSALYQVIALDDDATEKDTDMIIEQLPPLLEQDMEEMTALKSGAIYREFQATLSDLPTEEAEMDSPTKSEPANLAETSFDGPPPEDPVDNDVKMETEDVEDSDQEESPEDQQMYTFDPTINPSVAARTCPNCNRPFNSRGGLLCHVVATKCGKATLPPELAEAREVALAYNDTNCIQCKKAFKTVRDARVHVAFKRCDRALRDDALLPKVGNYFKCRVCSFTGVTSMKIFRHENAEHEDVLPHVHKCEHCDKAYCVNILLDRHVKSVHNNNDWVICEHCGKDVRRRYLNEHMRVVHQLQVTDNPPPVIYKEPVKCTHCSYTTIKHLNLCNHILRVHGPRNHQCPQCPSNFGLLTDLKQHIKQLHHLRSGPTEMVQCPKCAKHMRKRNLATHIRHVHEKTKEAFCDICQQSFANNFTLKAHMETHKKHSERTYRFRCYCGMQFNSRISMRDHENTHTLQRPYKCEECGKCFRHFSVLRKHKELHNNKFQCRTCRRSFPSSRQLQIHKYLKKHGSSHHDAPIKQACLCGTVLPQRSLREHQQNCDAWLGYYQYEQSKLPVTVTAQQPQVSEAAAEGVVAPGQALPLPEGDDSTMVVYQEDNKDGTTVYFIQPEGQKTEVSEEDIQNALLMMQDGQQQQQQQTQVGDVVSAVNGDGSMDISPTDSDTGLQVTTSAEEQYVSVPLLADSSLVLPPGVEHHNMVPISQLMGDLTPEEAQLGDVLVQQPEQVQLQDEQLQQEQLQQEQLEFQLNPETGHLVMMKDEEEEQQQQQEQELAQYQCGYCEEIFDDFDVVQQHMMEVHTENVPTGGTVQIEVQPATVPNPAL